MRIECLAQEDNTNSWARAHTLTAQPGDERTYYEATASPTVHWRVTPSILLAW